jgi:hypothetical protein
MIVSGSDFKVLSLTPLLSHPRNPSDTVPFTDDLRYQYDTEVSCLPYTISPFAAPDIANSLSPMDAKVDDDLRFIPTSVTPNVVRHHTLFQIILFGDSLRPSLQLIPFWCHSIWHITNIHYLALASLAHLPCLSKHTHQKYLFSPCYEQISYCGSIGPHHGGTIRPIFR